MEERFWSKVNKTSECWLWTGACDKKGHGRVSIKGKTMFAHRVSWLLAGNTIPEELIVRHKCRSRNCVNPAHLETGTFADNNGPDRRRDETLPCKLTAEQVLQIRTRSTENQRLLGEEFGVSQSTISSILNRITWSHL